MSSTIPDPATLHPLPGHDRTTFLKPLVTDPRIEVGEYTYYDDEEDATAFQERNVLYAYARKNSSLVSTVQSHQAPDF